MRRSVGVVGRLCGHLGGGLGGRLARPWPAEGPSPSNVPALGALVAAVLAYQSGRSSDDDAVAYTDLQYRPSNNIPSSEDSWTSPKPTISAPTPSPTTGVISSPIYDACASAAAREAAQTIDDIEGAGFRVLGHLGNGAYGSVYSAEVTATSGWAEDCPGAFTHAVSRMYEHKVRDGLLPAGTYPRRSLRNADAVSEPSPRCASVRRSRCSQRLAKGTRPEPCRCR